MGPSGETWIHGNTHPLSMREDQKVIITNLFRSIIILHHQYVRQNELGAIDPSLLVDINRLGMSINRLYSEIINTSIAELVNPLHSLLEYFKNCTPRQTLSLFEAIQGTSSYRWVDYPWLVLMPHIWHPPINEVRRFCQSTSAATLSWPNPDGDGTKVHPHPDSGNTAGIQADAVAITAATLARLRTRSPATSDMNFSTSTIQVPYFSNPRTPPIPARTGTVVDIQAVAPTGAPTVTLAPGTNPGANLRPDNTPPQWRTIETILNNLHPWKALQISIPNKHEEQLAYSVIFWKKVWDTIVLTLSRNDWDSEGHYKTIEVPANTTLENGQLTYSAWYNRWERKDLWEAKKMKGVQVMSEVADRKALSSYLASVTLTSPVVLSTINRHNDEVSRRDFTIIWAKKIGYDLYDIEIVRDDKGNKKQVRAKISWTPWSERIEFEGEYKDRWFFRDKVYEKYANPAIRNVTKVQLWMATKPSKWESAKNYLFPTKQSNTQQQWGLANAGKNKVNIPNNAWEIPKLKHQDLWYYSGKITENVSPRWINNALVIKTGNDETLVLNLVENISEQNSDYYRFSVQIGATNERSYLHIEKSDLNNLGKDGDYQLRISLSWTHLQQTIVSVSRILIQGKDVIEKATEARPSSQPQKRIEEKQQHWSIVSRGWDGMEWKNYLVSDNTSTTTHTSPIIGIPTRNTFFPALW